MRALYDRALDVALLHQLVRQQRLTGGAFLGHELLDETMIWLGGWGDNALKRHSHIASMNATLRVLQARGLVETKPGPFGGIEWRLHPDTSSGDLKRLTGGIDPWRVSLEECLELDTPSIEAARRVEFDPHGYLKVPGDKAKENRAIWQCPSIWELGARMKTIGDRKHTVKANRKDEDERPIASAA